jgi:hypothetical protein
VVRRRGRLGMVHSEGMQMPTTLRVHRTRSVFYRGDFDLVVDGAVVGAVAAGGDSEVQVAAGSHTLQVRRGRHSSAERTFDAVEGTPVWFVTHAVRTWPMYLVSQGKPDLAISLKQE